MRDKTDNIRNGIAEEQANLMREGFLELHAQAQMREAYIEPFVTRIAVRLQQIPYLCLLQMAAKACCPVEQQQRVRLSLRYAEDFDPLAGKHALYEASSPSKSSKRSLRKESRLAGRSPTSSGAAWKLMSCSKPSRPKMHHLLLKIIIIITLPVLYRKCFSITRRPIKFFDFAFVLL